MSELSPQGKRALLERSYADSYKRIGMPTDDVPRQVLADLEIVDAVDRAGELHPAAAPVSDEPPGRRYDAAEIQKAEAETGTRIARDDSERGEYVFVRELDASPLLTSEQWAKAGGRIARVLEGLGGSSDYRVAAKSAAMPALALEYAETYWYYMTRTRPAPVGKTDHNPFRFRSDADATRMLVAKVYSICDRTTGKWGSWYVK